MTFAEMERIIGSALPASAREYRTWWSNDYSRQPHAEQWLSAGWRTDEVDFVRGFVSFSRIQARELAYIRFFEALFEELRTRVGNAWRLYQPTRVGYYWQSVARVPEQTPFAGSTTFSFTRIRRPRVDFYIDTGDQARNKAIFDHLFARREAIQSAFGGALEWERIDTKRASRIAIYYDQSVDIHANPEALTALRAWGVEMLIRMKQALDAPTCEVLDELTLPVQEKDR